MTLFTRRNNRRSKPWPGSVPHFPTAPGWWVQWSGRADWQPATDAVGKCMRKILAGEGDCVVWVEREGVKA
jgi:hypothetical protein